MCKTFHYILTAICISSFAFKAVAAETNVISFAYTTSLAADASTPDTWMRKLNDGYWANGVPDAVKYAGDVTVTADLGRYMQLTKVELFTCSATGAETLATSSVMLECSQDHETWISLGFMNPAGDDSFSLSNFWTSARYVRLSCAKTTGADGQLLAEIVFSSSSVNSRALAAFSYTTWIPANPTDHADNSLIRLFDGLWSSSRDDSVQYGVRSINDVVPENPAYSVATNVLISITLDDVKTLRSVHLYAFNMQNNNYGTQRVTLSNSVDGVNWTCLGEQTLYESLIDTYNASAEVSRFDFILPDVKARYLAIACEKKDGANITRQLLGEVQIQESTFTPVVGDPLMYTYEVNKPTSTSNDRDSCPKLTDQVWTHVVNNALRFYDDVEITADLGAPMYVAGTDLVCWSNKFSASETYYGTGRVVVNGSLDKTNWTELAETTELLAYGNMFHHAVTFESYHRVRYLRLDLYRCDGTETGQDFTSQIIGELFIYRPPAGLLGEAPVEVAGAIPFAGFETDPLMNSGTLIKGGTTNGWTFSYTDGNNYCGYQRNNSPVSTNTFATYIYAPEGVQTAVMRGYGTMETQITVPQDGHYLLQYTMNASSYLYSGAPYYNGSYQFRVKLDGVEVDAETVLQLRYVTRQVLLRNLAAGTHILRFEGTLASLYYGVLIDDLKLFRYALPADQVTPQGANLTLVADSAMPLTLAFDGAIQVGDLWVEGEHLPKGKYSSDVNPIALDGPGYIGFSAGTVILVR